MHLVGFIVRINDIGNVVNTDRRTDSGTDTPAWWVSFPRTSLGLFKRCVSADAFRCGILTTNRSSGRQGWYPHSCALDGLSHTDRYFINCFDELCSRPYSPPMQEITSAFPSSARPTHATSFVDTPTSDIRQVTVAVTCDYYYRGRVLDGWRVPWLGRFVVLVGPSKKMSDKTASWPRPLPSQSLPVHRSLLVLPFACPLKYWQQLWITTK